MTKDDMTTPIPRDELAPILKDALEYDPLHSFTVKELHRLVDADLRTIHPEYHVHEQTVRQLLKEFVTLERDVYSREAALGEHPNANNNAGNRVGLYSLTNPVPVYSLELGAQITRDLPPPRPVPVSTRGRRPKTSELVDDTITRWQDEAQAEKTSSRADLICTLIRELAADTVSVDTLQARDDKITQLESTVEILRSQLKTAQDSAREDAKALKKIRSFLGDGV